MPQAQFARWDGRSLCEHRVHALAYRFLYLRRDDQVQQVLAQCFLFGVAIQHLGRLVPVRGGAVLLVALYGNGRNIAQQRAKAQFGFAQRTLGLEAFGDVAGQKNHCGLPVDRRSQRAGAPFEMAQARQGLHLVDKTLRLAAVQGFANQRNERVGLRCRQQVVYPFTQQLGGGCQQGGIVGGQYVDVATFGVEHQQHIRQGGGNGAQAGRTVRQCLIGRLAVFHVVQQHACHDCGRGENQQQGQGQ